MYNQNSGYGQALLNAIHSKVANLGRIFIVVSSSDTASEKYQRLQEVFRHDRSGRTRFFTSVEDAYDAMEDDNGDAMVLDGDSTHSLSAMLSVTKDRCHFLGLDYLMGLKRKYGQSTKVSLGVTVAATDIATIKNTGVRNSFRGIKFINENTVTEGIYCFVDGGEYTNIEYCEVYKSTDLDVTASAEFVCNADSPNYRHSTFGSLADARSGAVIRANMLFTKEIAGSGLVARDVEIEDCNFWIQSTNTANRFVYGANATDIERVAVFENCKFIANGASSAIPAQNVAFGATLTVGSVLLNNCTSVNASTAMSTTTGVFVNGPVPAADTVGIALQAS